MKKLFYLTCLVLSFSLQGGAQLSFGGLHAKFGVDGDTKAGTMQYRSVNGATLSDDWFNVSKSNNIRGIIDTTGAARIRAGLQSGKNLSFVRNMSTKMYTKSNGILLMDAIYMRDHTSALGFDSTCFGTAAKNGVDPRIWDGKASNIPAKTDFVDTYAHFRRDGSKVKDSLWFYTGVSTVGVQGERYFDIELFKNGVTYMPTTGTFNSTGLSFGHTEWLFDAFGNIIQTGDLIIAVSYSGGAPIIDVRIWVSKLTMTTAKPSLFRFGTNYDSGVPGQVAGYATILSRTGGTSFGSGIGNYSTTSALDTTYSTPWGTTGAGGTWSENYSQLQFVEIGLNFTRIGIDPAMYTTLFNTACDRIFHSIFFKSRSSNSFSANLQDFAGPITFSIPGLDYQVIPDTLTCDDNIANIGLSNISTEGFYTWTTTDGIILDTTDKSNIIVEGKGTYTLTAMLIDGCPQTRIDNVLIPVDSISPIATADLALAPDGVNIQLIGGDTAASNAMTPFGRSKGFKYKWSGPNNFRSDVLSPVNSGEWAYGNYEFEIREERNGCKATASVDVGFFKIVSSDDVKLGQTAPQNMVVTGEAKENNVILNWNKPSGSQISSFEVQKETAYGNFVPVSTIKSGNHSYSFTDVKVANGLNTYRIKAITKNGVAFYSAAVSVNTIGVFEKKIYLTKEERGNYYIVANVESAQNAKIAIFGAQGQLLGNRIVNLSKGYNKIQVPATNSNGVQIVSLYTNDKIVFSEKIAK